MGLTFSITTPVGSCCINDTLRRFYNLGITFCYKILVQFQRNTSILCLIQNFHPPAQVWSVSPELRTGKGIGLCSLTFWFGTGCGQPGWHHADVLWCHLLLHVADVHVYLGGGIQLLPAPPGLPQDSLGQLPWLTLDFCFCLNIPFLGHHLWAHFVSWLSALSSPLWPCYISLLLELICPQ